MSLNQKRVYGTYHGPVFGGGGGCDLVLLNSSNTNRNSYMNLQAFELAEGKSGHEGGKFIVGGSDYNFQTVEVEIYQVL